MKLVLRAVRIWHSWAFLENLRGLPWWQYFQESGTRRTEWLRRNWIYSGLCMRSFGVWVDIEKFCASFWWFKCTSSQLACALHESVKIVPIYYAFLFQKLREVSNYCPIVVAEVLCFFWKCDAQFPRGRTGLPFFFQNLLVLKFGPPLHAGNLCGWWFFLIFFCWLYVLLSRNRYRILLRLIAINVHFYSIYWMSCCRVVLNRRGSPVSV